MPRAVYGLAAVLWMTGMAGPLAAQPIPGTSVYGTPPLSTSLPPEPLSRSLPPEPSVSGNAAAVKPLPPVLGAPVNPAARDQQPTPAIRTVNAALSAQFSTDPSLATTPVQNYQPLAPVNRGSGFGVSTMGTAQVAAPSTQAYQQPGQAIAPSNPSNPLIPDVGVSTQATDPIDFLRQRTQNRNSVSGDNTSRERSSESFGGEFGEKLTEALGNRSEWFKSDHAFDGFISPVTNPFLFEDPRSLTEIRPIFLIEKIPGSEPDFRGGNTFFFGTQFRLAITDRLSFTINKLGLESFNPGSGSAYPSDTGFAEFWFGAKYTFIRNETTGTVMAGGLQFQIPTGGHDNFQDTGTLSLVPYVSIAQSFLRDFSFGSFNAMASTGYSFSVNHDRSDYFYLSGHLDWNVLNRNHFFPFIEANWFVTTTNGSTTPVGIEGQDLINFGGKAAGDGLFTTAFGARYKFNECYQVGTAFEFPLAGPRGIDQFRWTVDFIFRY